MELGIYQTLLFFGIAFVTIYYYITRNFDFWKKRNVRGPKPIPFFGNYKDILLGKIHLIHLNKQLYDEFSSELMYGTFERNIPTLVLKDPELIKDMIIKDFHSFPNHIWSAAPSDPLSQNLFFLEYEPWRPLRNKLSPVFTSGKLREMIYLMEDCGKKLEKYVTELVDSGRCIIDFRELAEKYTTQTISVCAFGLDTNSIKDEDSEFKRCGKSIFASNFSNIWRHMLSTFFPSIYSVIKPHIRTKEIKFFIKTMKETIDDRKKTGMKRNDFVDLLLALEDKSDNSGDFELFLTAQAMLFFAAGFETSASTISNLYYELALNHSIQEKLRLEILNELEADNGRLTYDNIKRMKYLDKLVKETLRKNPTAVTLQRKSVRTYTFRDTGVTIPKGTHVIVPVNAIHADPNIYPDPEKFDPERFDEVNEKNRHPMNYLPFGDGPRNCIGARFASYQSKIGIIALIRKFKVDVCDKTPIPIRIIPRCIVPTPEGGIHLKISKV